MAWDDTTHWFRGAWNSWFEQTWWNEACGKIAFAYPKDFIRHSLKHDAPIRTWAPSPSQLNVSVILISYNRWDMFHDAMKSVLEQTHRNLELIVVFDQPADRRYDEFVPSDSRVHVVRIQHGSKERFGEAHQGWVRNHGIRVARGQFIATLDDDDVWMNNKLEVQLARMWKDNAHLLCSEGYVGESRWHTQEDGHLKYAPYITDAKIAAKLDPPMEKYNSGKYWEHLQGDFSGLPGMDGATDLPLVITLEHFKRHNIIISASAILSSKLVGLVGGPCDYTPGGMEDMEYWARLLEVTDAAYVRTPLMIYDTSHGKSYPF